MKRLLFLTLFAVRCSLFTAFAQGIPFLKCFTADQYQAHNQNFDIEMGRDGIVYVANFEGLMYYDQAEWHILHTPGITRVTVVYRDKNDVIWVGGYNYFGRIFQKANGEQYLDRVPGSEMFHGEVQEIWESDGQLTFLVNDGNLYKFENNCVSLKKEISKTALNIGLTDIVKKDALEKDSGVVVLTDITQTESLGNGLKVSVKKGEGLVITNESGKTLYTVTEANGLCNNEVTYVAYDGHGVLWGATQKGVFSMAVPSAFSHFSRNEGLLGEVLSIENYDNRIYVGTTNGLFYQEGRAFVKVAGINHGCWQLELTPQGMLAATANGVYRIARGGVATQLTTASTTSVYSTGSQFYSGELNGVYLQQSDGSQRQKVCSLKKVTKICKDKNNVVWIQNIYGEIWHKSLSETGFRPYKKNKQMEEAATLVQTDNELMVVSADAIKPFSYPQFSYCDQSGVTWLTDNNGKSLYRWKNGKRLDDMKQLLQPFSGMTIRALYVKDHEIWFGDDEKLVVIDTNAKDPAIMTKPRLLFRSAILGGDSILWGGSGEMPQRLPQLSSDERDLRFVYALDYESPVGSALFRYRLNGGNWSVWADDHDAEFASLPYGSYTLEIQARLATGELTAIESLQFSIAYPFYMRWYMVVFYFLLAGLLVYALLRYRLHRLSQEKIKLEQIVQERTAEVVKQKDEIEEKSQSLEKALNELGEAQHELIRQEKMATVGKLTQGLIDRILNPLNYINNFSKLSEGLVKDVEANIEDDKDKMNEDNYEDTMDILDMLRGNLLKVSEHGQNTTRTLKAMEEMLKDRSGGIVPMDLLSVLRQDEEMLRTYYSDDIANYGIKSTFDIPQDTIRINGNADQLSKTLMSLLGNAVYAVVKKAQRQKFAPEVSLSVTTADDQVSIVIRDNGIGIENKIIDKIFDPFFTTKTTGEAAGVGLYLSREIVQNHGGDISVKSEKDVFTEFTITLPTPHTGQDYGKTS